MHLSTMAQNVRYGFFGDLDVAIIEAAQINERWLHCSNYICW